MPATEQDFLEHGLHNSRIALVGTHRRFIFRQKASTRLLKPSAFFMLESIEARANFQ
jgi:hypothetical protein